MDPIETEYKGYRFRSRLEARWAVFFEHLDVNWRYEPQGYEFDDGTKYLPDFFLPEKEIWIEVKGGQPNQDEVNKAKKLCWETDQYVLILVEPPNKRESFPDTITDHKKVFLERYTGDRAEMARKDLERGHPKIKDPESIRKRLNEGVPVVEALCTFAVLLDVEPEEFTAAAKAARSARFEHGEKGAGRS
jgi:hypothetical protein